MVVWESGETNRRKQAVGFHRLNLRFYLKNRRSTRPKNELRLFPLRSFVSTMQEKITRLFLAPFALLYGIGISMRNALYDRGFLKGVKFNLPVISVGNLSVGGSGKTPHIEYLIRLLREHLNVATLSRGYKRKTKGFRIVYAHNTAEESGDEPLQFRRKFPDIFVAVSESRAFGIPEIVKHQPDTEVVLLDDAFQHRAVQPGLNILLTEFSHPFTEDYLLPYGRLREWRKGYERADIIIVTKCPVDFREEERRQFLEAIRPLPHQSLYFSFYDYGYPYYIFDGRYKGQLDQEIDVLLVSAIARADYLVNYLEENVRSVTTMAYPDHHNFTKHDIGQVKMTFDRMESKRKVILTTEKDAVRLQLHKQFLTEHKLPIFALPVEVDFHGPDRASFDAQVQQFLLDFRV